MNFIETMLLVCGALILILSGQVVGRSIDQVSIKTIASKEGQVFDCVDIYKQPALEHPLLKNHKIQLKPIPFSEEQQLETSTPKIEMKSLGCPEGTVPILRVQEEVLQRASYLPQRTVSNAPHAPGHHFVLGRIRRRDNLQLYAGKTVMTVYNPKLIDGQFSEAAIWLSNGPPDQLNSIQVGWTVNPILYGDFRTHLFGYWTVDGFKQTGCFDMRCSGFVQISKELTLGSILEPTSNETHQYENPFNVFLDKTGNWWLSARDISVGYWPSKLFTSMSSHAADLAFGGVTYNDPDKNPAPMGSGYYSDDEYTCYARDINIMDGDRVYKNLDSVDFDIDSFESNCYAQRVGDFKDGNGYTSYFGGQGCRS